MSEETFVHPTALVENGVEIGPGSSIWDHVHLRGPSRIGREVSIGGKSYLAYDVVVGDRVKINSFVYVCARVTIETGVFVGAGVTFTNDRAPRATTPDLATRLPSEPDERTLATLVREGASLGARSLIGPGLVVGRFAMVGMGAVVTRDVPDFALVVGSPARVVGAVCRCGERLASAEGGRLPDVEAVSCPGCDRRYAIADGRVHEPR
ncbi:MAG: N-acetyltransferase [Planctomycetota bacterium]